MYCDFSSWKSDFIITELVSDFLPEFCKSKRSFGLFIHQAGTFGVNVLPMLSKLMFADSRTGKILTPKYLIKLSFAFIKIYVFWLKCHFMSWI